MKKKKNPDKYKYKKKGIASYTARVPEKSKHNFDKAILENKNLGHKRDTVTEHFLDFYTENGLPTLENIKDDDT